MKRSFFNCTCSVETRRFGIEPAIFITDDKDNVHMITVTTSGDFAISDEGKAGTRYDKLGNWVGNKQIETDSESYFYVIEATRDGVRKYVSRSFPRPHKYSIKLSKARRFDSKELAEEFIKSFNSVGKYPIADAKVLKVKRTFNIEHVCE